MPQNPSDKVLKTQSRSHPKLRPRSGEGILYNHTTTPYPGPPLFRKRPVKDGIDRAKRLLPSLLDNTLSTRKIKNADRRIAEIADAYWNKRWWIEGIKLSDVKKALAPIQKANQQLLKVLDASPDYVLGLCLTRHLELGLYEEPDDIESLRAKLRALARVCDNTLNESGKRGAPEKTHIKEAAEALASLWPKLSGKTFVRNFDSAPGESKAEEFLAAGPQFVLKLLQAIDTDVKFSEVKSVLKNSPQSTAVVSKKSDNSAGIP